MKRLECFLTHHWYSLQKTWLAYLLFPLSFLFSRGVRWRRWLYKKGWRKTYRAPCPVIIVGNITVGGVGKTPFIIALYFFLKQQGWLPGIVSRGYKGNYKKSAWVTAQSAVDEVGDEAVLLALRTGAPIVVGRHRVLAVKKMLKNTPCNIILCDDGLQHYALERDIEIAVVDVNRQQGNALCLPAGPLREPISRLEEVSLVAINGGNDLQCAFVFAGKELINLASAHTVQPIQNLCGKQVYAIAGIGFPQRFFNYLKSFNLEVIEQAYPDHYKFKAQDFRLIAEEDIVIMTEKDAVKCRPFARKNFWFLPIEACFNERLICHLQENIAKISREN